MTEAILGKLSSPLFIPVDDVNADKSVSAHGVDSLVVMELPHHLIRVITADVPLLEIMDTFSIRKSSRSAANVSKAVHLADKDSAA